MSSYDQGFLLTTGKSSFCNLPASKFHKCIALFSYQTYAVYRSITWKCLYEILSGVIRRQVSHKQCCLSPAECWKSKLPISRCIAIYLYSSQDRRMERYSIGISSSKTLWDQLSSLALIEARLSFIEQDTSANVWALVKRIPSFQESERESAGQK